MSNQAVDLNTVDGVIAFTTGVHNAAVELFKSKTPPTQSQISILSDCIDELHDFGQHDFAHALDDFMCAWVLESL